MRCRHSSAQRVIRTLPLSRVATEPTGAPIFLISRLALHTRNLEQDGRTSLLIDATSPSGDPLAGDRVTVMGRAAPADSLTARSRFLARHPSAAAYVDFGDFAFWRLDIERAHFIGGFGRIADIPGPDLLVPAAAAAAVASSEESLLAELNARPQDLATLAGSYLGLIDGSLRAIGFDPDGVDLVSEPSGGSPLRIPFAVRAHQPSEVRRNIEVLLQCNNH